MAVISRRKAMELGLKRYFTGEPCKRGHVSERHVSGTCLECQRKDKAEAYKADPAKFRDRVLSSYRRMNDGRLRNQLPKTPDSVRKEKQRAAVRVHYENNKPYYMARSMARRAMKLRAIPKWFGEFDRLVMMEAASLTRMRSSVTGIRWNADHIVPLAARKVSGLHVGINIQVIPEYLNKKKGNKLIFTQPGEWIRHI